MIDKGYKKLENASPEKYKDDQRWSRGHKESIKMHECNETRCYGWQDKRKMQSMWKTMLVRGSQSIERCRNAIEPTSMDWEAIEDPGTFSINPPSYWEGVEIAIKNSIRARQISRCRGGVEIA